MASTLPITDFSGGWNPRDAWSQVADNESPDMLNVTLDQRGGIMKRLGLTKVNGADQIVNTGNVQSLYYSSALDKIIAQVGADLYVSSDGGATWGTEFSVVLAEVGPNKIPVIKVVREHTGLGLKEAKDLVDAAPKPVKEGVAKDEAEKIKAALEAEGAKVEVK